jgi:hypothetical protein
MFIKRSEAEQKTTKNDSDKTSQNNVYKANKVSYKKTIKNDQNKNNKNKLFLSAAKQAILSNK